MTRVRQIGEYTTLLDDVVDYSDYNTDDRSILMYNQDIDDMTKIGIDNCIEHCGLWDTNGNVKFLGDEYQGGQVSKRDLDDDFLTFLSPVDGGARTRRMPVEFLFDIAKEYLSTQNILNGAQTLMNAIRKRFGNVPGVLTDAIGDRLLEIVGTGLGDTGSGLANALNNIGLRFG